MPDPEGRTWHELCSAALREGRRALLEASLRCFASLFTDRAISYRDERGFDHLEIALAVGVQKMVPSDLGSAGVLFTLDPDTGFPDVTVISSAWGLGESVVKGTVSPDQFVVFTPGLQGDYAVPILEREVGSKEEKVVCAPDRPDGTVTLPTTPEERSTLPLSDDEVIQLSRWGSILEEHYGYPLDIEWAKDGRDGALYIVQARPETVHHRAGPAGLRSYTLHERGEVLVTGTAVGDAVVRGAVRRIRSPAEGDGFQAGEILVTERTDPDRGPLLNRAAGVVTEQGGRTSHAAIVSRELGIPAVVGTGNAMSALEDGRAVTVSCAEGDRGFVYEGTPAFEAVEEELEGLPETRTRIMMNLGHPEAAFRWWRLPARGIGKLAAVGHPHPVVVRLSDFKTNEYAGLLGGAPFEPKEENPMLGFRGACRYYSDRSREGFALECQALRRVREQMGLANVVVMVPFCRTLSEADRVLEVMAEEGLVRGEAGLQVYMMCEVPSNVVLAEEFAKRFDGFSIGSNDLTQLVLGVDRDSGAPDLVSICDERDPAVVRMIEEVMRKAHGAGGTGLHGMRSLP